MKNQNKQILQLATFFFQNKKRFAKFVKSITLNNFQLARLILDNEFESVDDYTKSVSSFNFYYDSIEDLLMDSIINEIDGEEGRKRQVNKRTGSRPRRNRLNTIL